MFGRLLKQENERLKNLLCRWILIQETRAPCNMNKCIDFRRKEEASKALGPIRLSSMAHGALAVPTEQRAEAGAYIKGVLDVAYFSAIITNYPKPNSKWHKQIWQKQKIASEVIDLEQVHMDIFSDARVMVYMPKCIILRVRARIRPRPFWEASKKRGLAGGL